MMYLCSISHLVTQGLPNANIMLIAQGSFRCGACSIARFESMTSYGVTNQVKHPIGVGYAPFEFYKYMLSYQIWTETFRNDYRCVSDTDEGSVTRMVAPYEVTSG